MGKLPGRGCNFADAMRFVLHPLSQLVALLLLLSPAALSGQWQLSKQGEIRVLTCGPGQEELYSAFGHSAVRVKDPVSDLDLVYNYGVFNFDQPNFYLNFARGNLQYKLAVQDYGGFIRSYRQERRYVHEQVLQLSPQQKQAYFEFLQINAQPQNRSYAYDYFYDNCATRIRDGLKAVLGDSLRYADDFVEREESFREACDRYLRYQPWGDLGIDLCLGLPMDKTMSDWEYMFLPDYIEQGMAQAQLITARGHKPLVQETIHTVKAEEAPPSEKTFFTPTLCGWFLFALTLLLSVAARFGRFSLRGFDLSLMILSGFLGWFLMLLWTATDHRAAADNLNLLWAVPWQLPLGWLMLRRRWIKAAGIYWTIMTLWYGTVLLAWYFWPQDLHPAWLPLTLTLALRSYRYSKLPGREWLQNSTSFPRTSGGNTPGEH